MTDLESAEQKTLQRQQSSPWASPWLGVLWLLPAIALLLTLAVTQRLLHRRLRRVLSKYLTMAAAAVIALCVVAGHVVVLEHSFRTASGPLGTVVAVQQVRAEIADQKVETGLTKLIGPSCGKCSATLQAVSRLAESEAQPPKEACQPTDLKCITNEQGVHTQDVGAAEAGYGMSLVLIAVLTVLLLLLVSFGLSRYLDEYRYRQP